VVVPESLDWRLSPLTLTDDVVRSGKRAGEHWGKQGLALKRRPKRIRPLLNIHWPLSQRSSALALLEVNQYRRTKERPLLARVGL